MRVAGSIGLLMMFLSSLIPTKIPKVSQAPDSGIVGRLLEADSLDSLLDVGNFSAGKQRGSLLDPSLWGPVHAEPTQPTTDTLEARSFFLAFIS